MSLVTVNIYFFSTCLQVLPCHLDPRWWQSRRSVECWRVGGGFGPGWPQSWILDRSDPRWASLPGAADSVRPLQHTCPGSPPLRWTPACPGWIRCSAPEPRRSASTNPWSGKYKRAEGGEKRSIRYRNQNRDLLDGNWWTFNPLEQTPKLRRHNIKLKPRVTWWFVFQPDLTAQSDVGENHWVCVNPVQGIHHGLHSLDPILLADGSTLSLMHLHQLQNSWIIRFNTFKSKIKKMPQTQAVPYLLVVDGEQRTKLQ